MRTWWNKLEQSAVFLYLLHKHDFSQTPHDADDILFVQELLNEAKDVKEIRRFIGAYAYLMDLFSAAETDLSWVNVPETVKRVPITTEPFSDAELKTIEAYEENYLLMND